jgi:hypothetical protein
MTRIKCSRKVGPGFEYRSLPKGGDSSLNNSVENKDEVLYRTCTTYKVFTMWPQVYTVCDKIINICFNTFLMKYVVTVMLGGCPCCKGVGKGVT